MGVERTESKTNLPSKVEMPTYLPARSLTCLSPVTYFASSAVLPCETGLSSRSR